MSSKITVVVAGATGRFANFMVRSLLSKPNVYVHGIARTPSKVPEDVRSNPRFKVFQGDSTDVGAIREALRGANVCVCCYLGDNDLMTSGQKTLIDACIAEKVARYVAGDWCFDYRKMKVGDHPSKDPMILTNQYLEEKEKETNGAIKGIHILNGVLIEVFWTTAFTGVYDAEGPTLSTWGSVDDTWDGITYEDAAKFTAEIAADESATGFFGVLGDKKTLRQIAEEYEEVYGVKPKLESKGSMEEGHEKMTALFKQDPKNKWAYLAMFYNYWMLRDETRLTNLDNDRYPGFKPAGFKDVMKKYDRETLGKLAFIM